jgi:hypothetical protein
MCVIAVAGVAPCQCFSPGGNQTTSPGRAGALLLRRLMPTAGSACYFFIIIFIRYETTAAARWALLLIVRTLFYDAITVAVWTGFGFHVCLPVDIFASPTRQAKVMHREARQLGANRYSVGKAPPSR